MSNATTLASREQPAANQASEPGSSNLRVWPAVVLTIAFWLFLYANHTLEAATDTRFLARMIGYAIALLAFLGWWLSRSKVRWRDRLLALVVAIGFGAIAVQFADKTMNWFALLLTSFPVVMTVWTAWLLVARRFRPGVQRIGFCIAMFFTLGYFTLIRWDGLWAAQTAEMHWRWTPTKEQEFLASRESAAKERPETESARKKWTLQPGDRPEFRGPQRDGVVSGVTVAADWTEHPPKLLWRKRIGPGWSGMIVVDSHLVTQEQRAESEAVVCYDAATGNELWAHNDPVRFDEPLAGAGPRGTPTFADGYIYSLGGKGTLNCLMPETGAVVWSANIMDDARVAPADMPQWGYSVSPLIVDGLVVVFAGGTSDKSVVAYHAADGKLAWTRAGGKQSYSSPQLVTLNGKKQIVMHDTSAIRGLNIADGAELWSYPNGREFSLPMLQPHVCSADDLVVSITPGMARLNVTQNGEKWAAAARWTTSKLRPDFSDFVIHQDRIYGLNDGVLCCLDLETGEQVWKKLRLSHGQILLLPDQAAMIVSTEKGEVILVGFDQDGPSELCRFQAIEGKTWNGPVLVGNRLLLRNAAEMAAYEIKLQKSPLRSPATGLPVNSL